MVVRLRVCGLWMAILLVGMVALLPTTGVRAAPPVPSFAVSEYYPTVDPPAVRSFNAISAVGDVNNDGHLDLVTVTQYSPTNHLSVLLGNGSGTFQAPINTIFPSVNPDKIALGDFNKDGKLDVISVFNDRGYTEAATFFRGNGDGTFTAGTSPDTSSGCAFGVPVVGDFNGDGNLDFITTNNGCGTVSVYLGNGDGTFQPRVNFGAGTAPAGVAAGDLDGDGKLDLAIASADGVTVLHNTTPTGGALSFASIGTFAPRGDNVAIGDVNGDGKRDIVTTTSNGSVGFMSVLLNTTGSGALSFAAAVAYDDGTASRGTTSVAIADTNHDGFPDIIDELPANGTSDPSAGTVHVLLNNGDGTFGAPIISKANNQAYYLVAHDALGGDLDFNGDGSLDLVTAGGVIIVLLGTPPPSIQAVYGDDQQVLKSPAGTFSGIPFQLVAGIVDGFGAPLPATAVTFTVNAVGGVGGRFIAADPNSTTLSVTTKDGTNGTYAGMTDTIDLYPASAAGQFTVTATAAVDGATLSATYTLTILASLPTPTINAVLPAPATNATKQGPKTNATTAQPAGLIPPLVIIDPNQSYNIVVNGSGFVKQSYASQTNPPNPLEHIAAFFTRNPLSADYPSVAMDVVYISSTQLLVRVDGPTMLAGLSAATTANINIYNPESSPGANDRGISNPVFLTLSLPSPAPTGSKIAISGATRVIAPPGLAIVLPPVQVLDAQDQPLSGSVDGKAPSLTQTNGGNLVASGGGNIVASGGGNVLQTNGGNLVASGGGNIAQYDAAKPAAPSTVARVTQTGAVGSAPKRTVANPSMASDYITSTDANSIIMAAPVFMASPAPSPAPSPSMASPAASPTRLPTSTRTTATLLPSPHSRAPARRRAIPASPSPLPAPASSAARSSPTAASSSSRPSRMRPISVLLSPPTCSSTAVRSAYSSSTPTPTAAPPSPPPSPSPPPWRSTPSLPPSSPPVAPHSSSR